MSRIAHISAGLIILALAVAGCAPKPSAPTPPPRTTTPPRPAPPSATTQAGAVKIVAYINVSSGCQEPTIKLLKQLDQQYGDKVSLELVDFGDEGEGTKRWKGTGYDCMAIEVNGGLIQVWEDETGQRHVVNFRNPVGYYWTYDDLKSMIAAWVRGKAHVASEEEAKQVQPLRRVEVHIDSERAEENGKQVGHLVIGDQVAIKFRVPADGASPYERASRAADMLIAWLEGAPTPPMFKLKEIDGHWAVMLNDKVLAKVTEADAEAENVAPKKLAKQWMIGVRGAMSIAVRPQ